MPIRVNIDRAQRLIRFTVVGELVTSEMLSAVTSALRETEGESAYDILSDHQQIATPATPEQIRELVRLLAKQGEPHNGRRAAVVVSQAASFGMMRMLGARASGIGIDVGVFWTVEDALRFLDRSEAPDDQSG